MSYQLEKLQAEVEVAKEKFAAATAVEEQLSQAAKGLPDEEKEAANKKSYAAHLVAKEASNALKGAERKVNQDLAWTAAAKADRLAERAEYKLSSKRKDGRYKAATIAKLIAEYESAVLTALIKARQAANLYWSGPEAEQWSRSAAKWESILNTLRLADLSTIASVKKETS